MNIQYLFNYYRTKNVYTYWLALQLVGILGLMIYAIITYQKGSHQQFSVTIFEMIITFAFSIEVAIKIFIHKLKFLSSIWNILDVANLAIIVLLFCFSFGISVNQPTFAYNEDLPIIFLGLRYFSQLIRIILDLKNSKEIREAAQMSFEFEKIKNEQNTSTEIDMA